MRPKVSSSESFMLCTPKLIRVKLLAFKNAVCSGVKELGFASDVASVIADVSKLARIIDIRDSHSESVNTVGVPPPMYNVERFIRP